MLGADITSYHRRKFVISCAIQVDEPGSVIFLCNCRSNANEEDLNVLVVAPDGKLPWPLAC